MINPHVIVDIICFGIQEKRDRCQPDRSKLAEVWHNYAAQAVELILFTTGDYSEQLSMDHFLSVKKFSVATARFI